MAEVQKILSKLNNLEGKRTPFEPIWNKCAELCGQIPKIYLKDVSGRLQQVYFDSTATHAKNSFVASLKSVIVPSNQRWASLKSKQAGLVEDFEIKSYLEKVNDVLFAMRYNPESRFSSESDLLLEDIAIYGHSVWFTGDNKNGGTFYRNLPVDECYIDVDVRNNVNTVFRKYELSAQEAVDEFGEKATEQMRRRAKENPDLKSNFLHAVYPQPTNNKGMKFASVHIDIKDKSIIYESGYRVMPYSVPRYQPISGEVYARSPAMNAFNEILTINEMAKTMLRVGQLQADPTILASSDVSSTRGVGQSHVVVKNGLDAQGRPKFMAMQYSGNLQITLEMKNQVADIINKHFLVPLFQALTEIKQMTATEVEERKIEKASSIAPISEKLAYEWLNNMIMREIDIAGSYGYLDNVPDALMYQGSLSIEYESPSVKMQEASKIKGIYTTMEIVNAMAQANPEVLNKINYDKAVDLIADYNGVPTELLNPPEVIEQKNKMQEQMQQAQMALQATPVISEAVQKIGGGVL